MLEHAGDSRLLAMAYSNQAQLHVLAEQQAEAIEWGERAIRLARDADDAAILSHALNNVGLAKWRSAAPRGQPTIEESLRVALAAGEMEHACRAYVNLIWDLIEQLRFAEAERYLAAAMELADRSEHRMFLTLHACRAGHRQAGHRPVGRGDRAAEVAAEYARVDAQPGAGRPGPDPGAPRPAGCRPSRAIRAWELAAELRELPRTGPAAAARAEAAWLHGGDPARGRPCWSRRTPRPAGCAPWRCAAELAYWMTRFGRPIEPELVGAPVRPARGRALAGGRGGVASRGLPVRARRRPGRQPGTGGPADGARRTGCARRRAPGSPGSRPAA